MSIYFRPEATDNIPVDPNTAPNPTPTQASGITVLDVSTEPDHQLAASVLNTLASDTGANLEVGRIHSIDLFPAIPITESAESVLTRLATEGKAYYQALLTKEQWRQLEIIENSLLAIPREHRTALQRDQYIALRCIFVTKELGSTYLASKHLHYSIVNLEHNINQTVLKDLLGLNIKVCDPSSEHRANQRENPVLDILTEDQWQQIDNLRRQLRMYPNKSPEQIEILQAINYLYTVKEAGSYSQASRMLHKSMYEIKALITEHIFNGMFNMNRLVV